MPGKPARDIMPEDASKPALAFAFGIRPRLGPNGAVLSYDVQAQNYGLPDEIVITIVRNWLKVVEDNYYAKFRAATHTPGAPPEH